MIEFTCMLIIGVMLSGCGACWAPLPHVVGRLDRPDAATASPDGGPVEPWGRWAARQPVRACARDSVFTVDTTDDELEGGTGLNDRSAAGPRLSLAEALWLAANHPGPDTILFDATMFALEAPSTIVIDGSHEMPQNLGPVCIDARDRGVIITWGPSARTGMNEIDRRFTWPIESGSLQIGLELIDPMSGQSIATGGQVAGCHYSVRPTTELRSNFVSLTGGTFGPGNSAEGSVTYLLGGGTVSQNFFGLNPLTGERRPTDQAMMMSSASLIEENVIAANYRGILIYFGPVTIRNNHIGVGPGSMRFSVEGGEIPVIGVDLIGGPARVESNTIVSLTTAVRVFGSNAVATITKNQLRAPEGIRIFNSAMQPPTITAVTQGQVMGGCTTPGRIELFSGPADSASVFAEILVGEAECDASGQWAITAAPRSGTVLVATLTTSSGSTSEFSQPVPVP